MHSRWMIPLSILVLVHLADALTLNARWNSETERMMNIENAQKEKVCTLCEQYAAQAVEYLSQNKTHQEIIDSLHAVCSRMHSFEKQCKLLVDYYAPLFFMEVANVDPEVFCEKVNLCEKMNLISSLGQDQACTLCENTIAQLMEKLKDPETQLDIIQALLKACSQLENYKKECKRLVFEYGPVILVNAEKFLETTDVCLVLRVCKPNGLETFRQDLPADLILMDMER